MPRHLDWTLIQSFLAVADTGSLSAAARRLGLSQPTLGRQIRQMEADLGVTLFDRQPRGLRLTETGAALLPHARTMAEGMTQLALTASGQVQGLAGPVRLTASVFVAQHLLPPIVADLRRRLPEISVDVVATDRAENLLYREADIAVRMAETTQLDIVTRRLGEIEMGVFAAQSYLEGRALPQDLEALFALDLVGYDRSELLLRGLRAFGIQAHREGFATRCDNHAVVFELIRAGCGAGFVMADVARRDPGLVQLLPEVAVPGLPVWLAAHEAVRHTPRVARVWEALAKGLAPWVRGARTAG